MSLERDFSNFNLGDNVYELADGLVPEIAERLDVRVGSGPNSDDIQLILNQVGTNKVLRENQEIEAIGKDDKADLVERSGIQQPLSRSLWTPDVPLDASVDTLMFTGGVANWIDRMSDIAEGLSLDRPIYALGGNRVMDGPTDVTNPNVIALQEAHNELPTESGYIGEVVVPKLVKAGIDIRPVSFDTAKGDEILAQFLGENTDLLNSKLGMLRVANAGVIMALQLRDVARKLNPDFDSDKNNPQVFVATDTFPVSHTAEQDNDPAHYQKADPAFRQILLTAKKIVETSL